MDIRWRQRATRVSAGDLVHESWNLSTVSTGSITPSPEPPPPFTAACFSRRRGGLTTNGLHLNLPLELSNEPGPPHNRTQTPGARQRPRPVPLARSHQGRPLLPERERPAATDRDTGNGAGLQYGARTMKQSTIIPHCA